MRSAKDTPNRDHNGPRRRAKRPSSGSPATLPILLETFLIAVGTAVHKLTVARNSLMVQELMRRLEAASIDAFCASERGVVEIYSGAAPAIGVWIADARHLQRAAQLLRDVQAQQTSINCPECGYDLRGHPGKSTCPECGRDLAAPVPDVECPGCGEAVPVGFEVCWNCGAAVGGPQPPES